MLSAGHLVSRPKVYLEREVVGLILLTKLCSALQFINFSYRRYSAQALPEHNARGPFPPPCFQTFLRLFVIFLSLYSKLLVHETHPVFQLPWRCGLPLPQALSDAVPFSLKFSVAVPPPHPQLSPADVSISLSSLGSPSLIPHTTLDQLLFLYTVFFFFTTFLSLHNYTP